MFGYCPTTNHIRRRCLLIRSNALIIAVLLNASALISCTQENRNPDLIFSEYLEFIKTRFSDEALSCGEAEITGEVNSEQEGVTTCLYNAFANNQDAYGHFILGSPEERSRAWFSYTTTANKTELHLYSQHVNDPSERSNVLGQTCVNPSINTSSTSSFSTLFECESEVSAF